MSRTGEAKQAIRAVALETVQHIPPARRVRAVLQTAFGIGIGIGALLLPKLGFPWQASLAVAAFGGWIASQKLVMGFAGFIPKAIAAIMRALQGKNGTSGDAT